MAALYGIVDHRPAKNKRVTIASRPIARRRPRPHQPDLFGVAARRPKAFDPQKMALGIWRACSDPRTSTLAERWFASQGLSLPDDVGADVLRFHPSLSHNGDRSAGLVFLLRDLHSDEPTGVLRMFLDADGAEIGRRVLGAAWSSAIKLSDDTDVEEGLVIASSPETGIAAMCAGYRPIWVVVNASALAEFALDGIEALTIIGEHDARAAAECAERWRDAGREVAICALPRPP